MWEARLKWKFLSMIGDSWAVTSLHAASGMVWWLLVMPILIRSWLSLVLEQSKFRGKDGKKLAKMLKMEGELTRSGARGASTSTWTNKTKRKYSNRI